MGTTDEDITDADITDPDITAPDITDADVAVSYARRVGDRLRAIRRQKGLSLHEVEDASRQEFKASVLGAYERGERAISVPRLQRLGQFYRVPVDQLLPTPDGAEPAGETRRDDGRPERSSRRPGPGLDGNVTLDLTRLHGLEAPEAEMLQRYTTMVQMQRQDFNGRVLTIRGDDLRTIACLIGTDAETMVDRLEELGLRRLAP